MTKYGVVSPKGPGAKGFCRNYVRGSLGIYGFLSGNMEEHLRFQGYTTSLLESQMESHMKLVLYTKKGNPTMDPKMPESLFRGPPKRYSRFW